MHLLELFGFVFISCGGEVDRSVQWFVLTCSEIYEGNQLEKTTYGFSRIWICRKPHLVS